MAETKISFLDVEKGYTDKLHDLFTHRTKITSYKKKVRKKNKKGKFYSRTETIFRRKGIGQLAKVLKTTVAKLNDWYNTGFAGNKKVLQAEWKKLDLPSTFKRTLEFYGDTLSMNNWFQPPKLRRRKKNEQFYFKLGIYVECWNNSRKGEKYIIHNLPIPTGGEPNIQTSNFMDGWKEVFNSLKRTLQGLHSLILWRVNYFTVSIFDIEKQQTSESKNMANLRKKYYND